MPSWQVIQSGDMTANFRNTLRSLVISNNQSAFPLMMDAKSDDALGLLHA